VRVLQVLVDEKLADNAERQGQKLRARLGELQRDASRVSAVRGKVLHFSGKSNRRMLLRVHAAEVTLNMEQFSSL
jgi:acetylornithine/succinyldiaminopimelate/putrescine aminotransferase